MRVGELIKEPRLADAGLANDRHQLAQPRADELLRTAELIEFGLATDELGKPPNACRFQTGVRRARSDQFAHNMYYLHEFHIRQSLADSRVFAPV